MSRFVIRHIAGWLGLLSAVVAAWLIIHYATLLLEVVGILFGATLLSLAIVPIAERLAYWHVPRGITVLAVYILGGIVLIALIELLIPVIRIEAQALRSQGPHLFQQVTAWVSGLPVIGSTVLSMHQSTIPNLGQQLGNVIDSVVRILFGTGGLLLDLLIVTVLSFLFITDPGLPKRLIASWLPAAVQPRLQDFIERLRRRLTRWIWAQILIALYFVVVYSIGLSVLGVPFALTIGIVGGLLEIVPYVGGAFALILAVISSLSVSPWLVIWVIVFHVVVVELESHVIAPALYGRIIGVHPALMLLALFVGAKAGGVLGVFFAVPVTVVILACGQELRHSFTISNRTTNS